MSPSARESPPPPIEENEFDVCLGRGNGVASRMGNRHYRKTIKENQRKYQETRGNRAKEQVAQDIIDAFHSRGGTFYHRESKVWKKAPLSKILKTVKQALRERKRDVDVDHLPPSKRCGGKTKSVPTTVATKTPGLITMNGQTLKAIVWNLSDNNASYNTSFNTSFASSLNSSLTSSLTPSLTSSVSTFNDSEATLPSFSSSSKWPNLDGAIVTPYSSITSSSSGFASSGQSSHHRRRSSTFINNQLSPFASDDEGEDQDQAQDGQSVTTLNRNNLSEKKGGTMANLDVNEMVKKLQYFRKIEEENENKSRRNVRNYAKGSKRSSLPENFKETDNLQDFEPIPIAVHNRRKSMQDMPNSEPFCIQSGKTIDRLQDRRISMQQDMKNNKAFCGPIQKENNDLGENVKPLSSEDRRKAMQQDMLNNKAFNTAIQNINDTKSESCPVLPSIQQTYSADTTTSMDPSKIFESEGPLSQSDPLLYAPEFMGLGSSLKSFAVPNDDEYGFIEATRLAIAGPDKKSLERLGTAATSANSDDEDDDFVSPLKESSMRSQFGRSTGRRGFGNDLANETKDDNDSDDDDDDDDDDLQAAAPMPLRLMKSSTRLSKGEKITHKGITITASTSAYDDESMKSIFTSDESMKTKPQDADYNLDESLKSLWISNDSLRTGKIHQTIFDMKDEYDDFNKETKTIEQDEQF